MENKENNNLICFNSTNLILVLIAFICLFVFGLAQYANQSNKAIASKAYENKKKSIIRKPSSTPDQIINDIINKIYGDNGCRRELASTALEGNDIVKDFFQNKDGKACSEKPLIGSNCKSDFPLYGELYRIPVSVFSKFQSPIIAPCSNSKCEYFSTYNGSANKEIVNTRYGALYFWFYESKEEGLNDRLLYFYGPKKCMVVLSNGVVSTIPFQYAMEELKYSKMLNEHMKSDKDLLSLSNAFGPQRIFIENHLLTEFVNTVGPETYNSKYMIGYQNFGGNGNSSRLSNNELIKYIPYVYCLK